MAHAGGLCRCPMPMAHVDGPCRWPAPVPLPQCPVPMPRAHAPVEATLWYACCALLGFRGGCPGGDTNRLVLCVLCWVLFMYKCMHRGRSTACALRLQLAQEQRPGQAWVQPCGVSPRIQFRRPSRRNSSTVHMRNGAIRRGLRNCAEGLGLPTSLQALIRISASPPDCSSNLQ